MGGQLGESFLGSGRTVLTVFENQQSGFAGMSGAGGR